MNRRRFLASLPALYTATLVAAPSAPGRLLVVFLRGGYDATNVLVPASSFYHEARPTIGIPRESLLALDTDWSLHPALRESVYPLYQQKEALFIPFAGTENLSRSHFETQDTIELGQAHDRSRNYQSE